MAICIVDYGLGNLSSISNMLKRLGAQCVITSSPAEISEASLLILPGVGAFDAGMDSLNQSGLVPLLNDLVLRQHIPALGICLGMQLMTKRSDEGGTPGLGWINAVTRRFDFSDLAERLPVPHMGWANVTVMRDSPLTDDLPQNPRYYFVHSYHVECYDTDDVVLAAEYGRRFTAAFQHQNILGVQFHPEKSHHFGKALLRSVICNIKNYVSR